MIKKTLQSIRIKLGKKILDKSLKSSSQINHKNNIKKILFLRQDGKIGDMVVSSFAFRELKKQNPNLHIGVVCSKNNRYLLENNPYIDSLYEIKKRSIIDRIKCGLKLRKLNYDVLIDPTVLIRNRNLLFIRLINAKINIGYLKQNYKLFNINIKNKELHFSKIYKEALEQLGLQHINTTYDIPFNPKSEQDISTFLQQQHLNNFICINLFGAGSKRQFDQSKSAELLKYIMTNSSCSIVLLTFPGINDKLKQLIKDIQGENKIFIFENTKTIFHSIELIRNAKLCISPDTSIVHIAAGLNKPLICFYSQDQENFVNWSPNNTNTTHILRYKDNINETNISDIKPSWLI